MHPIGSAAKPLDSYRYPAQAVPLPLLGEGGRVIDPAMAGRSKETEATMFKLHESETGKQEI